MSHVLTLTPTAPGRWCLRCGCSGAQADVQAEPTETDLADALMAAGLTLLRYGLTWPQARRLAREALEAR